MLHVETGAGHDSELLAGASTNYLLVEAFTLFTK